MNGHDAISAVVNKVGLKEDQLAITQESNGRSVAKERIKWAASYLKKASAIVQPQRGVFDLGPNANKLLNLDRKITIADLKEIEEQKAYEAERALQASDSQRKDDVNNLGDDTPEDLINKGIKVLNSQLVDDLLEQVKALSPEAFEGLVLQVLAKIGYGGGDARQIQGVPRGRDGGIDGKINEDKLGLDQIYIQAKRYSESSVGRPAVDSFVGAMIRGGCKKGVFVTSSTFTSEAKAGAKDLRDQRLVLIDGVGLAKLMIEHCVGVQVKETIQVAKVDQDFFSGED